MHINLDTRNEIQKNLVMIHGNQRVIIKFNEILIQWSRINQYSSHFKQFLLNSSD